MSLSPTRVKRFLAGLVFCAFGVEEVSGQTPAQVTLLPTTSPTAGTPGVTNVSVTGSGFPTGTILPVSVDIALLPAGGTAIHTAASTVTTVAGTTRRVSFTIPATISVGAPTTYSVSITGTSSAGTAFASANAASLTVNPSASITSINPSSGVPGLRVVVAVLGRYTNFVQGATQANFGAGITVNAVNVVDATHANVIIDIAVTTTGIRTVTMTTGTEVATLLNGFTIVPAGPGTPTITDFSPKSGPIGTLVTITGANLQPNSGTGGQVSISKLGGGTLQAAPSSTSATSLSFVIPAGATTGPLSVTVNGQSATAASPLTVVPSSGFTISAVPAAAKLIQGQSVSYAVQLSSGNGFSQLAQLSVGGLPPGITATFTPTNITAGQTAVLTLTAPATQPVGSSTLTLSAAATVEGIPVSQSTTAALNVLAPTTSFAGRTVVSDALETPLAGVTVTMLGKDGNGNSTGCAGTTSSDGAGNFLLTSLPANCGGPQLVGFDGTTATSPTGKYAGVNLVYTFVSTKVTVSPVLVHLPRIDNQETFNVQQNATVDQSYSFNSVPGLSVTVYKGTTFTMPDGTKPSPFPLVGVQVAIDRLPDQKPTVPTMMMVFIVAFQPANATANQPVAVSYPNTLATSPGTNMALMTLDPTRGQMVPYGTGTVSSDGRQIVPDLDPGSTGHRFGIVHFDWHGPMPPPPPVLNPSPPTGGIGAGSGGSCSSCGQSLGGAPQIGEPVDLASGLYVSNVTDMVLSSGRGTVALQRIYRSLSTNDGPFGIGSGHNYNYQLDVGFIVASPLTANVVNPDGSRYPFAALPTGLLTNETIAHLQGASLTQNGGESRLRFKDGTTIVFQRYAAQALEIAEVDRNGNQITINRNPANPQQISSITDPVGRQLTFAYDTGNPNHVASITDPIGRVVKYAYNTTGTLDTVTDPSGAVTKYLYDSQFRLTNVIDPRKITVLENVYDANGRVSKQTLADGRVIFMGYELANSNAQMSFIRDVTATDNLGRGFFYRFNPQGYLIQANDSLGQSTIFNRDPGNNLLLSVSGNARCPVCLPEGSGDLTFTYDSSGNIKSRTDTLGNTTTYTYDPTFNQVNKIVDALGKQTTFNYDSQGNLLKVTDANGNASSFEYNSNGLLIRATDAANQKTTFMYDSFANLTSVTDPLNNATSFVYDAISRPVQTRDSLGRVTGSTYDLVGRLLTRTDAKRGVTTLDYDGNGNLLSVKDARNNTTFFTYDPMNRLATRKDPLGNIDTRTYDVDGNIIKFVDRRGQTSNFTYDNINRLITESYVEATVTRSYDSRSRLAQVSDSASGIFTYSYDPAGRLLNSSTPLGSVSYTYDARNATLSRQVAGQAAVNYTYDFAGNLLSAALPQASASFTYTPRNQLASIGRGNGVTSSFTYDFNARLLGLQHAKGATIIDAESYTYDAVGNRGSRQTSIGQALITQPRVNNYNTANQLVQFGATANVYDANGNLVQEGSNASYAWDARNRLKSVTSGGHTTNFAYDPAGNLLMQADSGTGVNLTTSYVLDRLTNVAAASLSDGSSYSVLSGQSLDSHLAVAQSNGRVWYALTDAIDSTVATADAAGGVEQYSYEPFGQTTTSGTYPFQFTGRMPVSGSLYYYRARFYNANTGRFLSEDPIGFSGGNVNLYAYVRNNPVRRVDPFGLTDILTGPLQPSQDTQNPPSNPSGCSVAGNFVQCMVTEELKGQPISKAADLAVGMCPFAETPFTAAVCITGFLYKTTEIPQTLIEAGQCYQEAQSQCAGCAYMQNFKWKLPQ